jgi:hypothetical protein
MANVSALVPYAHNLPSEQEAAATYRISTNAASLCGEIVKATAKIIQGKKFVQIEGWLSIAAAHGCLVSIRDVESIEGGVRAIAELRRMSDQSLLATAEGFVGDDEKTWANRPMFARRAMAQTRASSRVCRAAFAFVVVMIDKGLQTTPAEEMQGIEDSGGHVDGPGSSWGPRGKEGAIDDAEADGLMANAPAKKGSEIARDAANLAKSKKKVDDAIGTIKLSGQTVESLDGFMDDNRKAFAWIHERFPEEYDRLYAVYAQARADAEARAG